MRLFSVPAIFGASLLAALSACVPATTEQPVSKAAVETRNVYPATSDNGFTVPAVPAEKVPDQFERQVVDFETTEAPGTIIIDPSSKFLYFVTGKGKAIRYGVSVGRSGFEWHGTANVTNRKTWPTWTPPAEMIERDPKLSTWEKGQPGGPSNPLGARALYLTTNGRDYGYRIHGTPDWWSIGRNASSGCIRMINQDVIDLYNRVPENAKVIVLTRDGKMPSGLKLPPPQPKKKKPEPAPAVATTAEAATEAVPAAVQGPTSLPAPGALPETAPLPAPLPEEETAVETAPTVTPAAQETPAAAAEGAPAATAPVPDPVALACAVALVDGLCPER